MKNQFAVMHWSNRVLFKADDTGDIYVWLKKNSAFDSPGYTVIDRLTSMTWREGLFIQEFEEQMAKAAAATGDHKCLSEDDFRRFAREEFSKILDEFCDKAGLNKSVQTAEMSQALYTAVRTVADEVIQEHESQEHDDTDWGHRADYGGL